MNSLPQTDQTSSNRVPGSQERLLRTLQERLQPSAFSLLLVFLLALALRLLVWRWHELYPLGGDEREYLDQALTLLRERRYVELRLMRPPLYTGFLAACIYLLDSLVQRLRLVQAVISALTVLPVYALTIELLRDRRAALLAALLAALSYTLAANATELLTETLFLFGLATFFWLLLRATTDHRPPTTDHRPPTTDHRPPTTDHRRPPTTDHRPPTTDHRPPTTDHRPPTTDQRPTMTHSCRLPTADCRLPTGERAAGASIRRRQASHLGCWRCCARWRCRCCRLRCSGFWI
jgi:hypothetical protein